MCFDWLDRIFSWFLVMLSTTPPCNEGGEGLGPPWVFQAWKNKTRIKIYLTGIGLKGEKNKSPMHGLSCKAGQDHGKNNSKEWRSLSLRRHLDPVHCPVPGRGAQASNSDGDFTLGKAGRTGRSCPSTGKGQETGASDWGEGCTLVKDPEKNALGRNTHKGLYIWGCPSTGSRCHKVGHGGKETAASQWPLVQRILTAQR